MNVRLEPHTGTLRGFALILSIDGNAVQVLTVDVARAHPVVAASNVDLDIVPVFDPATEAPRRPVFAGGTSAGS